MLPTTGRVDADATALPLVYRHWVHGVFQYLHLLCVHSRVVSGPAWIVGHNPRCLNLSLLVPVCRACGCADPQRQLGQERVFFSICAYKPSFVHTHLHGMYHAGAFKFEFQMHTHRGAVV